MVFEVYRNVTFYAELDGNTFKLNESREQQLDTTISIMVLNTLYNIDIDNDEYKIKTWII